MNPVRVVKVGGSLFRPENLGVIALAEALRDFLNELKPRCTNVIITGGGAAADAIREQHRSEKIGDETAHWAAIRSMSGTARSLNHALTSSIFIDRHEQLISHLAQTTKHNTVADNTIADNTIAENVVYDNIVCDSYNFLRETEPHLSGIRLPVGWHVTSDSIAARVAIVLRAAELLLLKSAPVPQSLTESLTESSYQAKDLQAAAKLGYVDRFLPILANDLRRQCVIRCVDFGSSVNLVARHSNKHEAHLPAGAPKVIE